MSTIYINGHCLLQRVTGVERYAREIIKGFDRGGYPYQIIKPSGFWGSGKLGRNLWQQMVLPRQKQPDDILWSPANNGPIYARNHVITLHDMAVFPHPEWFSTAYATWKRTLVPRIAKRAKGILTVSEFSKSIISNHLDIDPQKIKVVYNGVNTDRFSPATEADIKSLRDKYDLPSNYLLTLGSLDPRKNFKRTVEAWNQSRKEEGLKDYVLAIAGATNANFSDLDVDFDNDSIKRLGYVDDEDLSALYSGAVGFLLPSLFEGFGLPVVEAMACGTPVITSNTTALDEVAGEAALKVDPTDVQSIKKGILELIHSPDLQDKLTDLGLKRIPNFSWDKAAENIYHYLQGT
ncbi:glycosyltransferase family 4 protein [Fodinibius salsisoli]|uniref:Glycosyltransferase family 4 protein n=1 Tax=Fodinibius salsisoli TaxID=2820877 RepID=A0ABT3PKC2_9BACT|nr:glycosyltransferase family 1 protein [Fodinibius salsisoli]MCW9706398.1 glycosyltransferase family 4 protein [Fodinibius salsisoli]